MHKGHSEFVLTSQYYRHSVTCYPFFSFICRCASMLHACGIWIRQSVTMSLRSEQSLVHKLKKIEMHCCHTGTGQHQACKTLLPNTFVQRRLLLRSSRTPPMRNLLRHLQFASTLQYTQLQVLRLFNDDTTINTKTSLPNLYKSCRQLVWSLVGQICEPVCT